MSDIPSDLTFRYARTGTPVIAGPLEHVLNTCQRLFNMAPEYDIYHPKGMGLDIRTRSRTAYSKKIRDRDYEYERMIQEQFNQYTDIVLTKVIVYFKNKLLIVALEGHWSGITFELQTSSDPNQLSTVIKPKEIIGDIY